MLTEAEKKFIEYWETVRDKESKPLRQFLLGIPYGFLYAIPMAFSAWTAKFWYVRAQAEANIYLNPVLIILIILCITLFVSFFYKKHQFEMRDQEYFRLKKKQSMEEGNSNIQS